MLIIQMDFRKKYAILTRLCKGDGDPSKNKVGNASHRQPMSIWSADGKQRHKLINKPLQLRKTTTSIDIQ